MFHEKERHMGKDKSTSSHKMSEHMTRRFTHKTQISLAKRERCMGKPELLP